MKRYSIVGFDHESFSMGEKVAKIEIFYSREWRSWGIQKYNKEGFLLGNAEWVYSKEEANREKKNLEKKYGIGRKGK